jgi:hypothetical protein
MTCTGCASATVTCRCTFVQKSRDRQVLPAYGLQALPVQDQDSKPESKPNTALLPVTLGENHGSGYFYLAKNRTFLLCVDTIQI